MHSSSASRGGASGRLPEQTQRSTNVDPTTLTTLQRLQQTLNGASPICMSYDEQYRRVEAPHTLPPPSQRCSALSASLTGRDSLPTTVTDDQEVRSLMQELLMLEGKEGEAAELAGPEADDDTAAAAAAAQEAPSAPAVAARDEAAVRAQEPAMDSELLRALAAARARSRVGSRRSALSRDTTATAASGGSKGRTPRPAKYTPRAPILPPDLAASLRPSTASRAIPLPRTRPSTSRPSSSRSTRSVSHAGPRLGVTGMAPPALPSAESVGAAEQAQRASRPQSARSHATRASSSTRGPNAPHMKDHVFDLFRASTVGVNPWQSVNATAFQGGPEYDRALLERDAEFCMEKSGFREYTEAALKYSNLMGSKFAKT